jgi:hypothetical protein
MLSSSHRIAGIAVLALGVAAIGVPGGSPTPAQAATSVTLEYAPAAPPAPYAEPVPPPPGAVEQFVWVPGRWHWNGHQYVWTAGIWQPRPYLRANWVPGHWVRDHHRWLWVEGHWG